MLQPGEQTTRIILWEIDDPSKHDDPRFHWSPERPLKLPDGSELSGPKGTSLAALRERFGGDEIEIDVPSFAAERLPNVLADRGRKVKLSISDWLDSDPERTYLIISHRYRPTAERAAEEKAQRGADTPFPPEAEAVRQEWRTALEAGDEDRARDLKRQLDAKVGALNWVKPYAHPDEGVEIQPGVYLLDARPQAGA
jgi:hypothetical protein